MTSLQMANQAQDIPLIVFYVENGEVSVIKKGEWDGGDIASLRQAVQEALVKPVPKCAHVL